MSPTAKFFDAVRIANNNGDGVRQIQMGAAYNRALIEEAGGQPKPGGFLQHFIGIEVHRNRYVPDDMAVLQDASGKIVGVIRL